MTQRNSVHRAMRNAVVGGLLGQQDRGSLVLCFAASQRLLHAYIAAFQVGEPLIAYCAGPAHRGSQGPALVLAVKFACSS